MSLPTWKLVLDFGENSEFASRSFKSDVCPCRYCWSEKCGTSLLRFSHFSSLPDSSSSDSANSLEEPKWKLVLLFGDGSELCSQPLKSDSCPCGFCWCELRHSKRPQDFDLRSFQRFLSAEAADSLGAIFSGNESRIVKAKTEDKTCSQYFNGSDASDEENSDVKSKDLKVELVKLEDDSEDESQDRSKDWKPKRGGTSEKAKPMLWCRECGKAVQGRSAMDQHLKAEHDSTRPFKCCLCTSRFKTRKEKCCHFQKTHKDKDGRYKCNQCKFTTAYAANITTHVRVHSRKKLFKCDRCDKAFFQLTNLSFHRKKIHAIGKTLLESRQKQQGSTGESLLQGRISDEISPQKTFANPDTPPPSSVVKSGITATKHEKTLKKPIEHPEVGTLSKNRKRHSPECGESFRKKLKLDQHLKIHNPTQPFKCFLCSARFGTRLQKLRHQFTHKDESGRYNCIHCDYSTTKTQLMPKHVRTHTGEKPYTCNQCPKSFSQSYHLKNHVLSIHTDDKPFQCDKCPRAYALPTLLRHHQKKHHRETPFKCKKCAKSFLEMKQLEDHQQIHPDCRPSQTQKVITTSSQTLNLSLDYSESRNFNATSSTRLDEADGRPSNPTCRSSGLQTLSQSKSRVPQTRLSKSFKLSTRTTTLKENLRKVLKNQPQRISKRPQKQKITKSNLGDSSSGIRRNKHWCHDCGKWFDSQEPLYQHLKQHNPSQPFKCGLCSVRFTTRQDEFAHRREHKSADGRYYCQLCEFSCNFSWNVIRHMRSHFSKKSRFTSHDVDQKEPLNEAKSPKLQTTAKSKLQPVQSFKCSLCTSMFKTLKQKVIKKHKDGEGLYVCNEDDCGYSCNLISAMVKHIQTHSQKQVYRCAFCGEPFKNLNELAHHDTTVHITKKLQKQFSSSSTAEENHNSKLEEQLEVQILNDRNYVADVGVHEKEPWSKNDTTASTKSSLKSCTPSKVMKSKKLHNYKNSTHPFSCSLCKSKFQTKQRKISHLQKHKNDNGDYQCRICDFVCKLLAKMVEHIGSHPQQQKPHKCDLCSSSFTEPSRLKRHQLVHTGERPYECDQCSKAFQNATHLKRHELTHLEVLPLLFDCNLCSKSFSEKAKLKRHLRGVHASETNCNFDQLP